MRFNSQPPEGGWDTTNQAQAALESFNSQPPEGGWAASRPAPSESRFNSQPPEGGWHHESHLHYRFQVSTHSRPKAAGTFFFKPLVDFVVSTHSRPKAAGAAR